MVTAPSLEILYIIREKDTMKTSTVLLVLLAVTMLSEVFFESDTAFRITKIAQSVAILVALYVEHRQKKQ